MADRGGGGAVEAPVIDVVMLWVEAGGITLLLFAGALLLFLYAAGGQSAAAVLAAVLLATGAALIVGGRLVIRGVHRGRRWAVITAGTIQLGWLGAIIGSSGIEWYGLLALICFELVLVTSYLRRTRPNSP